MPTSLNTDSRHHPADPRNCTPRVHKSTLKICHTFKGTETPSVPDRLEGYERTEPRSCTCIGYRPCRQHAASLRPLWQDEVHLHICFLARRKRTQRDQTHCARLTINVCY